MVGCEKKIFSDYFEKCAKYWTWLRTAGGAVKFGAFPNGTAFCTLHFTVIFMNFIVLCDSK